MPEIRWPILIGSWILTAGLSVSSTFLMRSCGSDITDRLSEQGTKLKGVEIKDGDKSDIIPYIKFNNNQYFISYDANRNPILVNEYPVTFKIGSQKKLIDNEIYIGNE
ncbi:MAG TPA: hypothetical protein VJB89_02265 [Candidatus Nanoarchaeia archaeon]|nr:hypothetical protein [Candidatus Nanoarchaeia archaeon]